MSLLKDPIVSYAKPMQPLTLPFQGPGVTANTFTNITLGLSNVEADNQRARKAWFSSCSIS
jgi:hypothetical protein